MKLYQSIIVLSRGIVFRGLGIMILAGALAGCAGPASRVKVVSPGDVAQAETPAIALYDNQDEPSRSYREVAHLSFDGTPGDYREAVREFQIKARRLGADALILGDATPFEGNRVPFDQEMRFGAVAIKYLD